MDEPKNQEKLATELRQRQRNTVFPDTLSGGGNVDALLWRGDPEAPRVQRWGMRIFGSFFCLIALGILASAIDRSVDASGIFLPALLASASFCLGLRMFRISLLRKDTGNTHTADD